MRKQHLNLNKKAFRHQSFSSGWWTWGTGVGVKVGGGFSETSLDRSADLNHQNYLFSAYFKTIALTLIIILRIDRMTTLNLFNLMNRSSSSLKCPTDGFPGGT